MSIVVLNVVVQLLKVSSLVVGLGFVGCFGYKGVPQLAGSVEGLKTLFLG